MEKKREKKKIVNNSNRLSYGIWPRDLIVNRRWPSVPSCNIVSNDEGCALWHIDWIKFQEKKICSYQLNIWYYAHWAAHILNWFLEPGCGKHCVSVVKYRSWFLSSGYSVVSSRAPTNPVGALFCFVLVSPWSRRSLTLLVVLFNVSMLSVMSCSV